MFWRHSKQPTPIVPCSVCTTSLCLGKSYLADLLSLPRGFAPQIPQRSLLLPNSHKDVIPVQDAAKGFFHLVDLIETVTEHICHHHLRERDIDSQREEATTVPGARQQAALLPSPDKLTRSAGTPVCLERVQQRSSTFPAFGTISLCC